jgi:hypothetical protein
MQQQCTTRTARASTVPPSIEVVCANLRGLDPELVQDITTARRWLEEISPEVIALLTEVRALEERACVVADGIDLVIGGREWPHRPGACQLRIDEVEV